MPTEFQQDDIHAFFVFLERRIQIGGSELTTEQSVQEFRAYQEELQRFVAETEPAVEHSERGVSKPLDTNAVMQRVRERLANEGITD